MTRWQQKLTKKQIYDILSVVEGFGLDCIYEDSPLPLVESLSEDGDGWTNKF